METKNITVSLAKCQGEFPKIKLDSTVTVRTKSGASYNFKYATLANILDSCLPVLLQNGICFTQTFKNDTLVTTLLDKSGEKLTSAIPINLNGATMQELGSRISYLKRYSISAMLGIVGEEDDDGNVADGNEMKKAAKKASPPAAKTTAKPDKQVTENFDFLKKVSALKKIIVEKEGKADSYYKCLGVHGFEHSNEIIEYSDQQAFGKALQTYLKM